MGQMSDEELAQKKEDDAWASKRELEVNRLWMYKMPGLTSKLLIEAAEASGTTNPMTGKSFELKFQLSSLAPEFFKRMKLYCEQKLDLDPHWEDAQYEKAIAPLLPQWRAGMEERRRTMDIGAEIKAREERAKLRKPARKRSRPAPNKQ